MWMRPSMLVAIGLTVAGVACQAQRTSREGTPEGRASSGGSSRVSVASRSDTAPDVVVGPAAAMIRPASRPVDVKAWKLPAGIRHDWLQDDCDMFWRVRSALPPDPDLAAFLKRFARGQRIDTVDLDFGFERRTMHLSGGYSSCAFMLASYEGRLLSMRVDCSSHLPIAEMRPVAEEALGPAFDRDPPVDSYFWWHVSYDVPLQMEQAHAALEERLGSPGLVMGTTDDIAGDLTRAYEMLMSPLEELTVGTTCGDGGGPAHGRLETDSLRAAGRIDLLRQILRGPNPEGRVYAARALAEMDAMNIDDQGITQWLAARPVSIQFCDGCIIFRRSSAEAFGGVPDPL
jgi:hypothetical protein